MSGENSVMNDKKICFIMCVNNEDYMEEQVAYLNHLQVPEGYEIDVLNVYGATSMTSGYNEAMHASDAKYKVYLHQDTFIINPNFIADLLEIFEEEQIGLVGMVGTPHMPENAIMWNDFRYGKLYCSMIYQAGISVIGEMSEKYMEVEAVDGFLMATQYDVEWREDLFQKWDFYDVSQSFEFRKKGYKVVVPNMETPWCIHDDGFFNLKNYYVERKKFLEEYHWGKQAKEKVSIIIPTYNREHLIQRAIKSVLNQSYGEFELLIVDDGSTDNTEEVVRQIKDDRIRYIRCEENKGAAAARNRGIAEAKYDYIAFQDSDDEWYPSKLEKQMKVMLESSEKTGVVYCEYHYDGVNGVEGISPSREIPLEQKQGYIFPELLAGNMIGTPTMLVKKECFDKVGLFNEKFPCLEDYELVLRIAREYEVGFVPECMVEVHANTESVTNNVEGYLYASCILAGTYKKELLEYGMFDIIVGSIVEKAKELNRLEDVVKYLEVVMAK